MFGRLLDRFAAMELTADAVDYRTSLTLRGLVGLPGPVSAPPERRPGR